MNSKATQMKTVAHTIHPEQYQSLFNSVDAIHKGQLDKASKTLDEISSQMAALQGMPSEILTLYFLEGLKSRLSNDGSQLSNLYLMPDQGQQIKMFNFMAEKFPLVRFSQELVNRAYCNDMLPGSNLFILDIGIGSGQQIARLLEMAVQNGKRPDKVTVTGIEPSRDSLEVAKNKLTTVAQNMAFDLEFIEIAKSFEALSPEDWNFLNNLLDKEKGHLIINASFALHHIKPVNIRDSLFRELQALQPASISIIEPYADFLAPNLPERFNNAWHHYGLTFMAIDKIDASYEEKTLLKRIFFCREIRDVLAENEQRTEQFETGEMWAERLEKAGFTLQALQNITSDVPGCPFVTVEQTLYYTGLCVEGHPIISIITGT